jgi:exodeoxyribonuclease V alpha subunit
LPSAGSAGGSTRVGDKVMQIRNNYDKGTAGVFNGSVGVITALSLEDSELRVLLDENEEVAYGFDELDELTHAYAVSIHRSQGSEYPCGRTAHDECVDDAAAQPAVYRCDPGQAAGDAGRQ